MIFGKLLQYCCCKNCRADKRTYAWPIVLRCVSSEDGMTADWSKIPFQILERIANRIVNEVVSVNRVVYDITSKPPGTIEWNKQILRT